MIIQELWRHIVDWDDELPSELKQRCGEWKKTLQDLPSMEIPRWYDIDFINEKSLQDRCRSFSDLNSNCILINGPEFTHENVITKPESCDIFRTDKTNLNINAITKTNSDIILSTEAIPLINWCYYSSLSKLVRHLAWILKLKRSWISGKEVQKREKIFHN